ncbi:MFS transporter [Streptomyces sp. 900105755]
MSRTAFKAPGDAHANRWKALVFIALAQLMIVLDTTIVNIALPSAQQDLGISDGDRQWVVTAYALAFGGLLLFGGRVSDLWGRKRAFVIGLVGFAAASALGGAATTGGAMFGARALQGAFGALLAPAALSLLAVMFTDTKERAKAFGIFGAIAGGGSAVGFILGGVLTEYLDWRWTFFVNVPFAIVAAAGAYVVVREPEGGRNRSSLDMPGVVLSILGLVSLVYGFTRAESDGWSDATTIGLLGASVVLLLAFVVNETRVKSPLLPLRVVTDRNRGGIYLSLGIAVIAMFGSFLFLTYYLQVVKGYSPIKSGLSFLPMVAGMMVGSTQIGTRLVTRVPARFLIGDAPYPRLPGPTPAPGVSDSAEPGPGALRRSTLTPWSASSPNWPRRRGVPLLQLRGGVLRGYFRCSLRSMLSLIFWAAVRRLSSSAGSSTSKTRSRTRATCPGAASTRWAWPASVRIAWV